MLSGSKYAILKSFFKPLRILLHKFSGIFMLNPLSTDSYMWVTLTPLLSYSCETALGVVDTLSFSTTMYPSGLQTGLAVVALSFSTAWTNSKLPVALINSSSIDNAPDTIKKKEVK